MRSFSANLALTFALLAPASLPARAQTACTGLCLQQVQCPAGQTTSISGTVFAPNNTDPLPNILVYIPNAPVDPFTPGVSCPVVGAPPSGSPLVGTTTAVDGTFTITNVPVGANIPLVIQSGRWRRQVTVPATTACANTSFSTRFPQNQTEGDIPLFAVATGGADNVECVLRKVGIQDSEFTDPSAGGRIQIYSGSGGPGALIDSATPSQTTLMGNLSTLNKYDVLMLPCQGGQYNQDATSLANFIQYVNAGGRVYASHFSYVWLYDNPPFDTVANWSVNGKSNSLPDGLATVDTSFAEGVTLSAWLQLVNASTTPGQIQLLTNKHDFNGVNPPNQSWLTLNYPTLSNPVMQFVFNTPLNGANQCGRVLFNEYHVETKPNGTSTSNVPFPQECNADAGTITAQEKLLEFSLFELTSNGSAATLTPTTQDFGAVPVNFPSAPQTFTWTNNSTFPASAAPTTTGDFAVTANNCSTVAAGTSCAITVVFTPTALGARTGVLTVGSNGNSLTSTLTGTGIPDLSISASTLAFGNLDVGASSTQNLTVTNVAPGPVAFPLALTSGTFTEKSFCPATIPAGVTCGVAVTFTPPSTGPQSNTLTVASGLPAALGLPVQLTGNGVDFFLAASPTSGADIAGVPASMHAVSTPIAGFAATITLTCTTNAPASTCTPAAASFIPAPTTTAVTLTTTSQYTVVGYGSFGAPGSSPLRTTLWLLALASAALITLRRRASTLTRGALFTLLLAAAALAATLPLAGCSGKLPAQNAQYTPPGSYTYTLTATDGFLTHSTTYTLNVSAK